MPYNLNNVVIMKMSFKNCKVDVVSVKIKSSQNTWNFEEIISSKEIRKTDIKIKNKIVNFELVEDNNDYIIGFIRSEIDKELPAKINKKTKAISALDVDDDHAITYGNVFLYSKDLKVLFYEINRNSIFLDDFVNLIYTAFKNSKKYEIKNGTFSIELGTIFRKHEYARALSMDLYKKFKLKIHQPQRLLQSIKSINKHIDDKIKQEFCDEIEFASRYDTDIAEIVFNVNKPKSNGGLNRNKMSKTINWLKEILKYGEIRENIDIIEVSGYSQDFDSAITPINLIGDVYFCKIKIEVPRLDSDLQKNDRIVKIRELFEREKVILEEYL